MELIYTEVLQPILLSLLRYAIYALGVVIAASLLYLIFAFVIPLVREKLGAERFDALVAKIKSYMCAAENRFTEAATGGLKSDFVIAKILEQWPKLDPSYIQLLIDGLMLPLENEGLVNVTPETDYREFIIDTVTAALDKKFASGGLANFTPPSDDNDKLLDNQNTLLQECVLDALEKLPKVTEAEAAADPKAAAIGEVANDLANIAVAVGAATYPADDEYADEDSAVYHDSHKPNPVPEALDAPPVD